MCIVAPLISFDRCLQWSNYINARKQSVPDFTAMQKEVQYAVSLAWHVKWWKHLYFKPAKRDSSSPCKDTQADDSVRQLYLILLCWTMCPVAQYRLWGHRMRQKQIDLTKPQQEVEGNTERLAECVTEPQLRWVDLGFPTHGDISQQVWA